MRRILVAYDGEEPARQALEQAADLAQAFGAELAVVSVTPRRGGRFAVDPWADGEVHLKAPKAASRRLAERGISARLYAPAGDPGRSIDDVAEREGYDTIVVGSRGLGPVGRLMQGSVSEQLATTAGVTVVVAR